MVVNSPTEEKMDVIHCISGSRMSLEKSVFVFYSRNKMNSLEFFLNGTDLSSNSGSSWNQTNY